MIKRPVLERGKRLWVGFQPAVYDKAVGQRGE
jgi:arsenate reductase-like glutaredoxin family protein